MATLGFLGDTKEDVNIAELPGLKGIIPQTLGPLPPHAIPYFMTRQLKQLLPGLHIAHYERNWIDYYVFFNSDECKTRPYSGLDQNSHLITRAGNLKKEKVEPSELYLRDGLFEVAWRGETLFVLVLLIDSHNQAWIAGPTKDVVDDFHAAAYFYQKPKKFDWEVAVASQMGDNVHYGTNESFKDVRFHSMISEHGLPQQITNDFKLFFASKELYQSKHIPWKRGALFLGPPGNGKTQMIKALVNELGVSTIYVKSIVGKDKSITHQNIFEIFGRARSIAPCLLIFEDLDSIVNESNKTQFLNELDGFESNDGIAVIATTNYPEKIDPALIHRPSRFDRKYYFEIPTPSERRIFLSNWFGAANEKLLPEHLDYVVEQTNGFSFAYLKELCITTMLAEISNTTTSIFDHISEQAAVLTMQIAQP